MVFFVPANHVFTMSNGRVISLVATTAATFYLVSNMYCMATSAKHPNSEALGACAGKELFERRLNKDFVEVKKVAKDYGLYFLCTK